MSSESGADVRTESPTAIAPETAAPCGFDCVVSREAMDSPSARVRNIESS